MVDFANSDGGDAMEGNVVEKERGVGAESLSLAGEMGNPYDQFDPSVLELQRMRARDPQARALSGAYTLPLAGQPGRLVPHEDDSGEYEFVQKALLASYHEGGMSTPLSDVITQMTTAVDVGVAFFERVWTTKRIDDQLRVVYHKVAFRPATTCSVVPDRNGTFGGFKQKAWRQDGSEVDEFFDPRYAFVYFRGGNRRPLKGESAFGTAYAAHRDKIEVLKLWREHLQQFGLGIMIGRHPKRASAEDKDTFWGKVKKIRGAARILLHPEEIIEFLKMPSTSEEFRDMIRYLDQQMAISALVQFLMLGTESQNGSWALSRDQTDFFVQALEAELRDMAGSITNYLIAPLVRRNFGEDAKFPRWEFVPLAETNRMRALEIYKTLLVSATSNVDSATWSAIEDQALVAMGLDPRGIREQAGKLEEDDENKGRYSMETLRLLRMAIERVEAELKGEAPAQDSGAADPGGVTGDPSGVPGAAVGGGAAPAGGTPPAGGGRAGGAV